MCLTMGLSGLPICGADVGGKHNLININRFYGISKRKIAFKMVLTRNFHAVFQSTRS
jgi:hypothetical protein